MVGPGTYNSHQAKDYIRKDLSCTAMLKQPHYGGKEKLTKGYYYVG